MSDILDRATALINGAKDHPDPERAMKALEAEALPEERHMFVMLWEGLVLKLNEAPVAPGQEGAFTQHAD